MRQHGWRRRLRRSPSHLTTTRLTRRPTTACIGRSPSCAKRLCVRMQRPHRHPRRMPTCADADVTALPSMFAGLLPGSLSPAAPPVEPTPLLPPAPPSSQDLLASILQQMTTPATTAVEYDGASGGGIAQFFVLGATLDPKVKAKIREGAYVDLGSLGAPSEASVSVAMGSDGQPSISLTPSGARPPASILEWIRLFGVYASVYVERHPAESPSLFSYIVNVMDLHRRHGGVAWRLYDERFRRIRAMAPELPWHIVNWDVAMGAIHSGPAGRQVAP